MDFNEYCQSLVDMSMDQRIELGTGAFAKVYGALKEAGVAEDNCAAVILALIKAGVSGDFSCSAEELELYNGIFSDNMSYDDFYNMTNGGGSSAFVANLDELVDSFADDVKFAACTLVGLFLAADDRLNRDEVGLLRKLLA